MEYVILSIEGTRGSEMKTKTTKPQAAKRWFEKKFTLPNGSIWLRNSYASSKHGDNLTRIEWTFEDEMGSHTYDRFKTKKAAFASLAAAVAAKEGN